MNKDRIDRYYFEVEVAYQPSEGDPVGCDGIYIKQVRRVYLKELASVVAKMAELEFEAGMQGEGDPDKQPVGILAIDAE